MTENQTTVMKTFTLYPDDLHIIREAAEPTARRENLSQALRRIIHEWSVFTQGEEQHETTAETALTDPAS